MKDNYVEISWKGRYMRVPSLEIDGTKVVVLGRLIKKALVHDEEWLEGEVERPAEVVEELIRHRLGADVFTFAQKVNEPEPRHCYHMDWDNVAAIPITTYEAWWQDSLPQVSRKNVRRGLKRGVVVRIVPFDDDLVRGIMSIQNESVLKRGTVNLHYGKDFATVRRDYASFLERSWFFGAFYAGELIGFIKLVRIGNMGSILNLLCMARHYDKRPANVLMAKVVEHCCQNGLTHLIYGKYDYGNKTGDPLTEFKRRNGFVKMLVPRYYIPLTLMGRLFVALRLYRGIIGLFPVWLIRVLLRVRAAIYRVWASIMLNAPREQVSPHLASREETDT